MTPSPYNPFASFYATLYGGIRDVAKKLGYAVAVHGSMVRDMDLVAVPWMEAAADPQDLVEAIREVVGGYIIPDGTPGGRWDTQKQQFVADTVKNPAVKPHGRLAWNIHLDSRLYVDLSVMPRCQPSVAD